jgi:Ser/Thr protein kinase RdoA (MazF antagonist)
MSRQYDAIEHPHDKYVPTARETTHLCDEFRIGKLISVGRDLGGLLNKNLLIETTKGQYAVRVMSAYARSRHIEFTQNVLRTLHHSGVPVVFPVQSTSGKFYTRLNGRKVQITPYIKANRFSGDRRQIYSSGRMQRKFHQALKHMEKGPTPIWSNYPSSRVIQKGLNQVNEYRHHLSSYDLKTVHKLHDRVMDKWSRIDKGSLRTTIVHCDWHLWNQLYTSKGDVCCILDFDSVQRRERVHDVGYSLWSLFSHEHLRNSAGDFLRGYKRLHDDEYHILPLVMARASLFSLCTASLMTRPVESFYITYKVQEPLLKWVLSREGQEKIRGLRNFRD